MTEPVPITRADCTSAELHDLASECKSAPQARRLRAIALVLDGWPRSQVGRALGTTAQLVRDWVVRYKKPGELLRPPPAEPAVARPALEGAGLPARGADPAPLPLEHVAEAAPGEPLEAEIVVPVRERVPAAALVRLGESHRHVGEAKAPRSGAENARFAVHVCVIT